MVCAVRKCIVSPFTAGHVFSRRLKLFFQSRFFSITPSVIDNDLSGGEVNLQRCPVVNAAQIRHEHVIDEYPHVVIAGELIGDRRAVRCLSIILLEEPGGHGHSEIVVD